jgi:isopentenyl phosphate kinase
MEKTLKVGVVAAAMAWGFGAVAAEPKPADAKPVTASAKTGELTLKGTVGCAKCTHGVADKCHTAIKVKEKGKEAVYYFDEKTNEKHAEAYCGSSGDEGTVTGTVSEKDGKKWVQVAKFEVAEKKK